MRNAPAYAHMHMRVYLANFVEKTFADSSETAKNAKVFSLGSFPLYGTVDVIHTGL